MTAHKLTRKQLKQDSFVDWTGRALEFVQENYVRMALAVGAIVVVILAVSFYTQGQQKARQEASFLLYQGESLLYRGAHEAALERLQECRDRHGSTLYGKRAALDMVHAHLALGDPEGALAVLQSSEGQVGGEADLRREFLQLKGAALMDLSRHGEAESIYRLLQGEDLGGNERYEVGMRLADCLKLTGRVPEAVAVLEELKAAADRGEIPTQTRDLETRLQLFRALAR